MLYVNGQVEGTLNPGPQTVSYSGEALTIGEHNIFPTARRGFDGLIDEVTFYNRALSASEIQGIYNASSAGKCTNIPPPVCVNPPSGLISWWPGENNANDVHSNNHGTPQNGATFSIGKVGQAFSFDGVDDYVEVPDSPSLTPPSSSLTLEAWVKPDAVNGNYVIISKYNSNNPSVNGVSWYLGLDTIIRPGHLRFAIYQNPAVSIARTIDTNNPVLLAGVWQHVAATFDLATQEMKIYVNGVEVPNTLEPGSATLTSIADSHTPVRIGVAVHVAGNFANFWDGLIDEAGIYNRALSASEIQSIYNAGSAGKCKECTPPDVSITGNEPVCPNTAHTYTANTNAAIPTFEWSVTGGTIDGDNTGSSVSVTAGSAATMAVSVEVTDGATNCSNSATQEITVEDTEAPVITATANLITLWPPNHQYVAINISQCVAAVTDNCATLSPNNVIITQVTSDEPEDAKGGGDGNTKNDMVIAANCQSVQLRSEREGSGNGRVYTIHLSVNDGNGNIDAATYLVTVPKSQNGNPAVNDGPVYTVNGSCGSAAKFAGEDLTQETLPEGYALEQNYPNPFNPSTSIAFSVKEAGVVQLSIYNLHGQEVRTLINGQMNTGFHSVNWDGKDERGQIVPSGVYLYKLRVNGFAQTRKMTFMK